ncbi:MAG: CoA-binding protein [Planctomycetaceae bacterium]|nr:CoA-binding protein [Planctomycetaceae bacterium]
MILTTDAQISEFLAGDTFAVVGASTDRQKYGNKVLRCYLQNERNVVPVNPKADVVEGVPAVAHLRDIPEPPHGISIITPPSITADVVREAAALKIQHIWMQPGAESDEAIDLCHRAGINLIHSGPCLLVVLGYRE